MTRAWKIAGSLIGAALLLRDGAAVAQATTQTYVINQAALATTNTSGIVTMGGYYNLGDGGGGLLYPIPAGCNQNLGTIFKDGHGHCLARVNPTNNVREWGAHCDVVAVRPTPTTTAVWNPELVDTMHTSIVGAVVVSTSLLDTATTTITPSPAIGRNIAISQVGGPTLWVSGTGVAKPAMWATRASYLSNRGMNFKRGDLVSFIGTTNLGSFSQQIAIIVDAIGAGGSIAQWHFLWGGLYDADPTKAPDATFAVDPDHSSLQGSPAGSGAVLTVDWSGWSLLNNQTMGSRGWGYMAGDTITMSENTTLNGTMDGSVVNQSQYPTLVVESVDANGGVVSYDWLSYGSYSTLPTNLASPANLMLLTSVVSSRPNGPGHGSGFTISPVMWTQGPLATTIADVQPDLTTTGLTDIFLTDVGTFPVTTPPVPLMPIQFFYYSDDDGFAINKALKSQSAASIATGDGASFTLPGACGTTVPINLPHDTTPNFVNPALAGANFQSSGLYAMALPLAQRGITQVLSRVLYGGMPNAFGGGFSNMLIEGMGIPEGVGYYGLAQGAKPPGYPSNAYVGPTSSTVPFPTAGDAVLIVSGKYLRIRNVHVSDGGLGSGSSEYRCGIDESDPGGFLGNNGVGNSTFSNSRFDANPLFSGPTNADIALRIGNSCHDSAYRGVTAFDGVKADVLEYNGNLFSQLHVGSSAFGAEPGLADPTLVFITGTGGNSGFAGVADYGVYAMGNTSLAQTQCDIANLACVQVAINVGLGTANPGQISDTAMACGPLRSVPPNYYGVEVSAGAVHTTVTGTVAAGQCNVPAMQLITADGVAGPIGAAGAIDPSVSLCNNSNSPVVFCGGYQSGFASGRYYTQPALGYASSAALNGAAANTPLYAIPFVNPTGGPITQIGLQVTTPGPSGAMCELGVYSSVKGAPGALLLDAGPVTASAPAGPQMITGLTFYVQPGTLYFLAVGCNAAVSVEGTANTNGLAGLLVGEPDFTTFGATAISATWPTFTAHGLPATFPTPIGYANVTNSTPAPNVYVGP